MATYRYDEPMSRDFPGAPNRLRVPPELGCYMANCPPANLTPPTISTLLLPASTIVSTAAAPAPVSDSGGMGLLGLLGIGAVAWLLLGGKQRNPRRNVEMGYHAKGVFHPIRASYDYSASRAGEGRKKRSRSKPKARRRRR